MSGNHEGDFISIVGSDGSVEGHIPYTSDTMFIIHRGSKNYYIDPVEK